MSPAQKAELQKALDTHREISLVEDARRRFDNHAVAVKLRRVTILKAWGGDR